MPTRSHAVPAWVESLLPRSRTLLRLDEVAGILEVTDQHIRNMVAKGHLKAGGKRSVTAQSLRDFIIRRTAPKTPPGNLRPGQPSGGRQKTPKPAAMRGRDQNLSRSKPEKSPQTVVRKRGAN